MRVIRPNCRQRFTAGDYGFLAKAVFPEGDPGTLWRYLVEDPNHLDDLLDKPTLYRSLLEMGNCIQVSLPFYFYVLVRHSLMQHDLADKDLADYVAALLSDFAFHPRMDTPVEDEPARHYYFELLQALQNAQGERRFLISVHIGNKALFETGMLHHSVEERERRRAAPGIGFLEGLGTEHFLQAAHDQMANQFGMVSLFLTLGQAFHLTRLALNQLSDNVVCLRETDAVSQLLKSISAK